MVGDMPPMSVSSLDHVSMIILALDHASRPAGTGRLAPVHNQLSR